MKGIILGGGSGKRLFPMTLAVSKQLLPVGDKPLIYYPLSVLMLAGIKEIVLICDSRDIEAYRSLLGDGSVLGMSIEYVIQPKPEGIAQAFLLAADKIAGSPVALVLGDNIFYGSSFSSFLRKSACLTSGAKIFAYKVVDPERFGVVEFNRDGSVKSIEEKPDYPKSSYAVTGLYFYDNQVVEFAKDLAPSPRGELEISDLNQRYLDEGQLSVETLGRGFAWLDTGTFKTMAEASAFINAVEARQGVKVACLEEIAYANGWIDVDTLESRAKYLEKSEYGFYLQKIVREFKNHEGG